MNQEPKLYFMAAQLEKLVHHLEALKIAEYVELFQRPYKLILLNFIAGLARGLGIAIGATLIFAIMLDFLRRLIMLNIPGIGNFIAEIIRIVEMKNTQF